MKQTKHAQSSIHFKKVRGRRHPLKHNCRIGWQPTNVYKELSHLNLMSSDIDTALELYNEMVEKAKQKYKERTGQKCQATAYHWHAVLNMKSTHCLDDLKRAVELIEAKLGYRAYHYVIHRDEGHHDTHGNWKCNEHAHILFCSLDENGINVSRNVTPKKLQELQTELAKVLGMQRGEFNSRKSV